MRRLRFLSFIPSIILGIYGITMGNRKTCKKKNVILEGMTFLFEDKESGLSLPE